MSREGRVTVVVLTYQRAAEVVATVGRLTALPERPRVIVVDNGSTDGTAAAVTRAASGASVVHLAANRGAAGRNAGLRLAATSYVALADDDTWWAPGALARGADLLDAHPRAAVLTARILIEPGSREDPASARMAASPLPRDPRVPGAAVLGFMAGAALVRRDAVLAAGGFHPRLFLGGEEHLLALDLAAAGWGLGYVAELTVHHAPSPHRDVAARRRLLLRNAIWAAWLRRPARTALRTTLAAARTAVRDPALRPALVQAAAGVGWTLRHRRVVSPALERALRRLDAQRSQA
jgi:GT2 family glycosyltransferase